MNDTLIDFVQRNKVVIHLGAHKTATTYIQSSLKAHRAALKLSGVALILPGDLRPTGILRRSFRKTARSEIDEAHPDLNRLLTKIAADPAVLRIALSEENIMGSPGRNLAKKSLYSGLDQRLRTLSETLNHPNVTFLLALRDYGSFVSSNITTAVRRGNVYDLESLRSAFLTLHRSWPDVISDLRTAFPETQIRIWQFEQFQRLEQKIFTAVTGRSVMPRAAPVFKTLSGNAMNFILDHVDPKAETNLTQKLVSKATREYPVSADNPPFDLWSPEQASHLTRRYALDVQQLTAAFPDMFLRTH